MVLRTSRAARSRSPRPHHVLLGVTGGIAAYKALELVRLFHKAGWDVQAVMTESARKFVGPESFRALTGHPVALELFPRTRPTSPTSQTGQTPGRIEHVDLATSADLVVVAPATANIIGKLASGIADDLLSTLLLAIPKKTVQDGKVIFAPAMNMNMWQNPAVAANIRQLSAAGYRFVSPGEGELACGTSGPGRMAEPQVIFEQCRTALRVSPSPIGHAPLFAGTRVVVTAGRTEEPLDRVRVITNRSSGRMGVELARAFLDAGAEVRLIAGELSVPLPTGVTVIRATTTEKMLKSVLAGLPRTDVLVMCAAVADYRPVHAAPGKHHEPAITVRLERTPDILKEVSRRHHHALVIGFSLDDSAARARTKLEDKRLDLIVANPFATAGSGAIRARLATRSGRPRNLKPMSKPDFARVLVGEVAELLHGRTKK
ncbi:MAG TPA: bifunctional phosphopantothenoylcysteine decarboxylase/phosphopantothenate--cysteine ligase CoaBC [bacterium]|nr:bifunctional phosphopantothenoylcysteine decarboxylase/phosphopantothenate--cysteine ligase CoaBC [bacterium]